MNNKIEELRSVDCEDQGIMETEHCTKCRIGFDGDKPIYPRLELEERFNKFWVCPVCHGSYGEHAFANAPKIAADIRARASLAGKGE